MYGFILNSWLSCPTSQGINIWYRRKDNEGVRVYIAYTILPFIQTMYMILQKFTLYNNVYLIFPVNTKMDDACILYISSPINSIMFNFTWICCTGISYRFLIRLTYGNLNIHISCLALDSWQHAALNTNAEYFNALAPYTFETYLLRKKTICLWQTPQQKSKTM